MDRSSRSSSTKPFIGHSESDVPAGGLPSKKQVLKMIAWFREQPKSQKKPVENFCCPLKYSEKVAQCLLDGGCIEIGQPCLAYKVKLRWDQAGILTVVDTRIVEKLVKIQKEYNTVFDRRNRQSLAAETEREIYLASIEETFDIKDPNARIAILNNKNRSDKDREEDLAFFDDYLGEKATRSWQLAKRDSDYDGAMVASAEKRARKEMAERKKKDREQKEKQRLEGGFISEDEILQAMEEEREEGTSCESSERHSDTSNGEKSKKRFRRRSSKGRSGGGGGSSGGDSSDEDAGVWALIPKEILKLTAPTATRFGLSIGQHVGMTAAFLGSCQVPLDQFPLSYSTGYRRRTEVQEDIYQESRRKFRDEAVAGQLPLQH